MASISQPNLIQSFQWHEDPWFWTTKEVIAALCLDDGPLRTSGSQRSFPDPQFLARTLEENAISGPSLLTDLNNVSLRDDLGIKALGHRTSILHYIQDLRRQSSKYLDHVRKDSEPTLSPADMATGFSCVASSENAHHRLFLPRGPEADRSSLSSTNYAAADLDINTYVSPTPSNFAHRLVIARNNPSEALVQNQETFDILEDTVNMAGEQIIENSKFSKRPHSPEADQISSHGKLTVGYPNKLDASGPKAVKDVRLAETCFIDENGRKRRRLDLSAQVPALEISFGSGVASPIGPSHLCDSSGKVNGSEDVQSPHKSNLKNPTTPLAFSLNSQERGEITIDGQGRKRLIPTHVAHIDQGRGTAGPRPQTPEVFSPVSHPLGTSPVNFPSDFHEAQRQLASVRKPHQTYLGLKSFAVDTIFYGDTVFGGEIQNDCIIDLKNLNAETFVFSGQHFGQGLRRYIGTRIKHYLMNRLLMVNKQENQIILTPYPDRLLKKPQRLSATLFTISPTGPIAIRVDRSKCIQRNNKSEQGFVDNVLGMSSPSFAQIDTEDVDWNYLHKWDHQAVEDKILPIYGESGSEGEYDPQTWHEIEAEKKSVNPTAYRANKKYLTQAEVENNLEDAEKQIVAQWEVAKKPGLQRKARSFWEVHKNDSHERSQLKSSLERLETRLLKIRSEIMKVKWSSCKQLQKQCRSMEASIFDREELSHLLWILNKKTPPPRMPPKLSNKSKAASRNISGEKRWSDSSDLDDFIAEDDFLTADESAMSDYEASKGREDFDKINDDELGTLPEFSDDELVSEGQESIRRPASSVPRQNQATPILTEKFDYQPNFIDLTQRSDSSSLETSPVKPQPSEVILGLPLYHRDPFGPKPKPKPKPLTKFKIPPGASPTIVIDSDPIEAPTQDDQNPSGLDKVKEISKKNPDEFVMLNDRKSLLFWTIQKTSADLRDSIQDQIENASLNQVQSTIWSGLKVIERNKVLKIRGLDEQDSRSCLLLASWFVCWTIPVKLNTKGVDAVHLRKTLENEAGFPAFFEFLKKTLANPKSPSSERSIKPQRRSRKRALQEDESEYLISSPHKKRKYAVPESDRTMSLRANALLRVQERDRRQELLKRRFKEMGVNDENASKVIVNPGKHDEQSFIHLNPKIADRIQLHQIEGIRFMWREVIADHQGCLLAQTMGLGKTMQIITLLVTIAEAAKSDESDIRAQVPEDLRKSRTLILCPPALIENWWDEFLIWTPVPFEANVGELRKVTSTLKVSERLWEIQAWREEGGVLLLGFNTFRDLIQNKVKTTGRMLDDEQHKIVTETLLDWPNIIVADEAHQAKTAGSGINVTLNRVRSMTRIALTGSPLANNLEEYHSLIDWISPGYLGTPLEFRANYVERIQAGLWQDSTAAQYRDSLKRLEALKQELAPKVHRADITVLQGRLQEKQEFVIKVALTPIQEEVYRVCVEAMSTVIDGQLKRKSTSSVLAWLAVLRLLCNHPKCLRDRLTEGSSPDGPGTLTPRKSIFVHQSDNEATLPDGADILVDALVNAPVSSIGVSESLLERQLAPFARMTVPLESVGLSNKMQILMDILQYSREVKDKVLIFSHSLHTLDYVEDQLRGTRISFSRIDGSVLTGSRQQITKDFNNHDTEVCLISTRAGGQGLNLFGANRVVILDNHFNPMYEEQAVGRAYRIGQRKPVFVYHLMAGGTFEEILQNQSVFKQQLAKRVVDQKNPTRQATQALKAYLLPPRAVEHKDLAPFQGKDTSVLDRILAAQNE